MMDSVRAAVLGSGSAMRFGEAAGATVSISEAIGPPCHCPVPARRSNSGRIGMRMTIVSVSGSRDSTFRFMKEMKGELSRSVWISSLLSGSLIGTISPESGADDDLAEDLPVFQQAQRLARFG